MDVLHRGQERYNVYCTPCHSRVGNGAGMIVQRGYRPAGNFHTDRLRNAPLGHFYAVISNGYGAMPDYSAQITPEDRWADRRLHQGAAAFAECRRRRTSLPVSIRSRSTTSRTTPASRRALSKTGTCPQRPT